MQYHYCLLYILHIFQNIAIVIAKKIPKINEKSAHISNIEYKTIDYYQFLMCCFRQIDSCIFSPINIYKHKKTQMPEYGSICVCYYFFCISANSSVVISRHSPGARASSSGRLPIFIRLRESKTALVEPIILFI